MVVGFDDESAGFSAKAVDRDDAFGFGIPGGAVRGSLDAEAMTGANLGVLAAANDWMAIYSNDLEGSIEQLGETPTKAELQAGRTAVPVLFLRPGVMLNGPPGPKF